MSGLGSGSEEPGDDYEDISYDEYFGRWFEDEEIQEIIISNLRKSTVIGDKMVELLGEVEKKGTGGGVFAVSGELKDAPITCIKLKSDGTILKFPFLEENEVEMLIPKFKVSPYGRGEETLVDATVRNSWQMNPAGFEVTNKKWNQYISETVSPLIKEKLGITDSFVAKPYKLLLYKTGSFFKPHRDSEKEEGMFGTLVVQLPSKYTGGELIVRHGGSSENFDHSTKGDGEEYVNYYSAFYCDCEHEVLPLKNGARLCLIYNLVLKKERKNESPRELASPSLKKGFENILKEWRLNSNDAEEFSGDEDKVDYFDHELRIRTAAKKDDGPSPHHSPRLIYLLAHQYSEQSLNYANLKGTDKTVANFLMEMAQDLEVVGFLGIMGRYIYCNSGRVYFFGERYESGKPTVTINNLRLLAMDKDLVPLVPPSHLDCEHLGIRFEEREVIPKSRLENLKAYKSDVEYTGNAGTDVRKQYQSSCILIFPSENLFFHCLKTLDNKTAEQMFLSKLQKYKAEKKEELIKILGKAFLKRQRRIIKKSYEDMRKWLKVFIGIGDKGLLSIFIKTYWMIINSNLKAVLYSFLANRWNPLWVYLFEELNAQMKQIVSFERSSRPASSKSKVEDKVITADEFHSVLKMIINKKDESVISAFLQGYGYLLFVRMNEVLPTILGTRATIGDGSLRTELIKLFENAKPARNNYKINWSSALEGIICINDGGNLLLSSFLTACSTAIKQDIDQFLPNFLKLKVKFGDRFIIKELRQVFSRPPAADKFHQEAQLTVAFGILLQFKDANLMSDFISAYGTVIANPFKDVDFIPAILDMEPLFGWKMVSDELKKVIGQVCSYNYAPSRQLDIVSKVMEKWKDGRADVIQSCIEYVKIIFEKCADWKDDSYHTEQRFKELGELAPKLNLDITEFLESRSTSFIVKLLEDVADRNEKKLNTAWLKVGISIFERMKTNRTVGDDKLLPQLKKLLTASGHRFCKACIMVNASCIFHST